MGEPTYTHIHISQCIAIAANGTTWLIMDDECAWDIVGLRWVVLGCVALC